MTMFASGFHSSTSSFACQMCGDGTSKPTEHREPGSKTAALIWWPLHDSQARVGLERVETGLVAGTAGAHQPDGMALAGSLVEPPRRSRRPGQVIYSRLQRPAGLDESTRDMSVMVSRGPRSTNRENHRFRRSFSGTALRLWGLREVADPVSPRADPNLCPAPGQMPFDRLPTLANRLPGRSPCWTTHWPPARPHAARSASVLVSGADRRRSPPIKFVARLGSPSPAIRSARTCRRPAQERCVRPALLEATLGHAE